MKLESNAAIQILRPVSDVYEGIVDPANMTNYFISESSGRMETGKELLWKFPEFPDRYPVSEIEVVADRSVSFVWDPDTRVNITLEELPDNSTLVRVNEGSKELNETNLKWVLENTAGWGNFLACLKAYLEHGINLRKGAFDFMGKN